MAIGASAGRRLGVLLTDDDAVGELLQSHAP
jgi:hypothetical protein